MRKAIGVTGLILGTIQALFGLALITSFTGYVITNIIEDIPIVSWNDTIPLIITFALLFGGAGHIITGSLALGRKPDKTVAVWAIVIGALFGFITMILGIILLSNTNQAAALNNVKIYNTQKSSSLTYVDAEIENVKKQIELAKLKKELERLNNM